MSIRVELSDRGTGKTTRMMAGVANLLRSRNISEPIVIASPNLNIQRYSKDTLRSMAALMGIDELAKTDIFWVSFPDNIDQMLEIQHKMIHRGITAAFVDEVDMLKPIEGVAEMFMNIPRDSYFYGTPTSLLTLDDLEAHLSGEKYDPMISVLKAAKWKYLSHTFNMYHFT